MSTYCNTKEELVEAIKNDAEYIVVEGDLKNHIIRIKATGKVAWGVCAVALTIAIGSVIAAKYAAVGAGGAGIATDALVGTVAISTVAATLGSTAIPAVAIGVAAGGIGALNTLRDKYKIAEKNEKYIKLQRK